MTKSFTLITLYLIAFAGFTSFSWLFPVIPYYASSLNISVSDIGFVVSLYSYVNAIFILPCGILSDRWGRRNFLITGLIIATVVPFMYPFARDIWSLYTIRILHGLGSALFIPTALATVTDVARQGEHGRVMGWYTAASQLGLMAGPISGGYILEHFGFEIAFYSCSLLPLLGLIFISTRMHAIPQKPVHQPIDNLHPLKWLMQRGAVISLAALAVTAIGSSAVSTFMPLYVQGFGISEAGAGMIITACYASSAALRIPSGNMADKFGNGRMIIIGVALSAIAIALFPAFTVLPQLATIAVVFGLGMGFSMPAALSWLAHLSPPHKRGLSMGMGAAAFQVGLALGATVMGVIVQYNGFTTMYLIAAGIIGLSTAFFVLFLTLGKRRAM